MYYVLSVIGEPREIKRSVFTCFFFNDTAPTEIYTLSLHDALPISSPTPPRSRRRAQAALDRWQGDVHDADVQLAHEPGELGDRQRPPPLRVGRSGDGWLGVRLTCPWRRLTAGATRATQGARARPRRPRRRRRGACRAPARCSRTCPATARATRHRRTGTAGRRRARWRRPATRRSSYRAAAGSGRAAPRRRPRPPPGGTASLATG